MAKLGFVFDAAAHQALSNLSIATDLAKAGIYVFPCKQDKTPLTGVFWRSASTLDEFKIRNWWDRNPDALVAIDCGKSRLLVIDADGAAGRAQWEEVRAGRAGGVPAVTTPGGGTHFYFRQAEGREHGNGRGALPAKVEVGSELEGLDVRGRGGYVIAPGSTLSEGDAYEPHDADVLSAPVAPDWLLDLLSGTRAREDAPETPTNSEKIQTTPTATYGRLQAYGAAALDAECSRVAGMGKGWRNEALNRAAFALGTLIGPGCLTATQIEASLLVAADACGLVREDGRRACVGTIRSGLRAGEAKPREVPEGSDYELDAAVGAAYAASILANARAIVTNDDGEILDAETHEVLKPSPCGPGDALDALPYGKGVDWTRPGGLLEDMTQFILRSSRRPNRPFAVAAATAVLSGVCGRHLYGPTGTALNLYMVCLAGTTVGKNRPLSAVYEILRAAQLGMLHTTGKGFSVSAIEQMITDKPACVATVDEIGANLLGRMSNRNSNNHELAMRGALLELWSREIGMAPFATTHRAGGGSVEVPSPSLTIFGASTPEAFYGAVTMGSVKDGFLNRFLLAQAAPRARAQEPAPEERVVPSSISTRLARLIPTNGGNLSQSAAVYTLAVEPVGTVIPWANGVRAVAAEMEEAILDVMDANPEAAPLMGRVYEYSVRLATLRAISRDGRTAEVTPDDLEWGAAWAIGSAKAMLNAAGAMMASNDYEQKFNAVRGTIERAGLITRRELLRQVRSVSARERDDIVKHLIEGGWVEATNEKTDGREAHGWRWIG